MERHFAFFRQDDGGYVREWKGDVPTPDSGELANDWATRVSAPEPGEIGLDVTGIGWPEGDFCYCRFDVVDRMLDWGPPRRYVEFEVGPDYVEVIANAESHRIIRPAFQNRVILDVTGTSWEPFWGQIWGRVDRTAGQAAFVVPSARGALVAALSDDVITGISIEQKEAVRV